MSGMGPLQDGGRVVVVGGGPGGTGSALALKHLARQAGRTIDVILLESKEFAGERNHNLSVGVLSPPLPDLLPEKLGIPWPRHLVRAEIAGYILHSPHGSVVLDDEHEPGLAIRRVQFDEYMLDHAREAGVDVQTARAVDLDFHDTGVVVYTDRDPVQADVVVGAFGLDEGGIGIFGRATGYRQPAWFTSILTKYHPGDVGIRDFGNYIHAFLPGYRGIEFGAITPKGNHITVNIAGPSVSISDMHYFMTRPEVRSALPALDQARHYDPNDMRFFKGRFPNSLAHAYYGDRYVIVGDAAGLVRAFKGKGVTSAVQTGVRAAETILRTGISRQAFESDYAVANRDITDDLPWGRVMRLLVAVSTRTGMLNPVVTAARRDAHVRQALFGAVSAHAPYRDVLLGMLDPGAVRAVVGAMLRPERNGKG